MRIPSRRFEELVDLTRSVHPRDGAIRRHSIATQVDERSVIREVEMRRPIGDIVGDIVHDVLLMVVLVAPHLDREIDEGPHCRRRKFAAGKDEVQGAALRAETVQYAHQIA